MGRRSDGVKGELLRRAFGAANGAAIRKLWHGDWSAYPSSSEARLVDNLLAAIPTSRCALELGGLREEGRPHA